MKLGDKVRISGRDVNPRYQGKFGVITKVWDNDYFQVTVDGKELGLFRNELLLVESK